MSKGAGTKDYIKEIVNFPNQVFRIAMLNLDIPLSYP